MRTGAAGASGREAVAVSGGGGACARFCGWCPWGVRCGVVLCAMVENGVNDIGLRDVGDAP